MAGSCFDNKSPCHLAGHLQPVANRETDKRTGGREGAVGVKQSDKHICCFALSQKAICLSS